MGLTTDIDNQIIAQLLSVDLFNDNGLTSDTCGTDVDTVIPNMFKEEAKFGCILTVGPAGRQNREAFDSGVAGKRGKQWVWRVFGGLMIRFGGDTQEIEDTVRLSLDELRELLASNRRLNGYVDFAEVVSVDSPETMEVEIGDSRIPFYIIGFAIEVWVKS